MTNELDKFINKLLDDIRNLSPETFLMREQEYCQIKNQIRAYDFVAGIFRSNPDLRNNFAFELRYMNNGFKVEPVVVVTK